MGKLASKWRKNENNTDISLYQICLLKLHENIWKNFGLNLFKEIAIGFNYGLQTFSESAANFSDSLLILISKCWRYPCLQFIFSVAQNFVGLSLNRAPHIIKGFEICVVLLPDVKGDGVAEIFLQLIVESPVCVVWYRGSSW